VKPLFIVLLLAATAFAQDATRLAPACGPNGASFDVVTTKNPHKAATPDAGKALVYFIEDDTRFDTVPKPTVRAGLDGAWAGATHGNSFFAVSVDPGEHHLCASWQTYGLVFRAGTRSAAAQLTAEAGHSYYFRIKNVFRKDESPILADFELIDSDEGQLLANSYSLSLFDPKKK